MILSLVLKIKYHFGILFLFRKYFSIIKKKFMIKIMTKIFTEVLALIMLINHTAVNGKIDIGKNLTGFSSSEIRATPQ